MSMAGLSKRYYASIGAVLCLAGLIILQLMLKKPIVLNAVNQKEPNEVGTTPYFQELCQRNDILPLPLKCSDVSNTNTTNTDYSNVTRFLDCYNEIAENTTKTINFFAFAHGDTYLDMLPLYAFFALSSNQDSVVEMVVQNQTDFLQTHAKELVWIMNHFGIDSVCVRNMQPNITQRTNTSNTWRYLEPPVRHAQYTYIGDVDIFLTESVLDPKRMDQMKTWNIPYSNIIRPNTHRLTGVMLMRTNDFYTPKLLELQQTMTDVTGNDETVLYKIVNASGIGLPRLLNASDDDSLYQYRPLHGAHLTTSRGPGKRMCLTNFHDEHFCGLLSTRWLNEFLCLVSNNIVMDAIQKISTQMKLKMTHKNRTKCS
jgi:hypothetical protein